MIRCLAAVCSFFLLILPSPPLILGIHSSSNDEFISAADEIMSLFLPTRVFCVRRFGPRSRFGNLLLFCPSLEQNACVSLARAVFSISHVCVSQGNSSKMILRLGAVSRVGFWGGRKLLVPPRPLPFHAVEQRRFSTTQNGPASSLSPPSSPSSSQGDSSVTFQTAMLRSSGMAAQGTKEVLTLLEHNASINVFQTVDCERPFSNTKFICTLGPSTNSVAAIERLIAEGMTVARLNFSHGSHETHGKSIAMVRQAALNLNRPLTSIALDTKGAEIRTGNFLPEVKVRAKVDSPNGDVWFRHGNTVYLTNDPAYKEACSEQVLYIGFGPLMTEVPLARNGVLIADGALTLDVVARTKLPDDLVLPGAGSAPSALQCTVSCSSGLSGRNNVHFPGVDPDLSTFTEQDRSDVAFGVAHGVDMIFASFVRCADDVLQIRRFLADLKATNVRIISKIENHRGVRDIDNIIAVSDGVMVARGDLGVDIPAEKVFLAQKMMIAKCNAAACPVICATQMLESMKTNSRPTRAEATDVANAVIDGADCVMLSGETAGGRYPVESVQTLRRISVEAYHHIRHNKRFRDVLEVHRGVFLGEHDSVACAAVLTSFELNASCIITTTVSGNSVLRLCKYYPRCPVIAVCFRLHVARALSIVRGAVPVYYPELSSESMRESDWGNRFDEVVARLTADLSSGRLTHVDGLSEAVLGVPRAADVAALGASGNDSGVNSKAHRYAVVTCTDMRSAIPLERAMMRICLL